jgi:hypothetical protein
MLIWFVLHICVVINIRTELHHVCEINYYTYVYTNIQQDATIVSWFYCQITLHVSGNLRAQNMVSDLAT